MKKDSLMYTVIFSFTITFILVFILSLASSSTNKIVEKNERITVARAYLLASGVNIDENSDITSLFTKTFGVESPGIDPLKANIEGHDIIVSPFSGQGLWGTITGVIAVNANFSNIVGFEITSHSETPGLGGRIEEDWFKDQFKGETLANDIKIVQSGGMGDSDPNNGILDGVTGATRTSESVQIIINKQIRALKGEVSFEDSLSEENKLKYHYLIASGIKVTSIDELEQGFNLIFSSSDFTSEFITGNLNGNDVVASTFTSKGHWDDITGVLVIDNNNEKIVGLDIISHFEKAGAPISEDWFKNQFKNLEVSKDIKLIQEGMPVPKDDNINILDGIVGATSTNSAIENGVNEVMNAFRLKGGIYE